MTREKSKVKMWNKFPNEDTITADLFEGAYWEWDYELSKRDIHPEILERNFPLGEGASPVDIEFGSDIEVKYKI